MKSLVWKQWRESRFFLALFTAWMIVAAGYAVGYELGHRFRAVVGSFSTLASFYGTLAAIVLAMRTARGEHTDGTISFSAALPVSLRRLGTVRIVGAVATLAIPIVIAASLMALALASGLVEQKMPRFHLTEAYTRLLERKSAPLATSLEQLASVTAIDVLGSVQLLLVLSLLGCWLRNQAQIGLVGAVLALGSMIAAGVLWFGERNAYAQLIYGVLMPQSLVIHWGYSGFGDVPGGYTDHELARYRWLALGLAIPWLALIGRWFVTRYGARQAVPLPVTRRRWRFALPPVWSRVPLRFPGRWLAILWLELRQAVPLAVCGLLLAALISVASLLLDRREGHSFGTAVLMDLPHSVFFVGMLWAVVVGSSLYSADLGSGLGSFWRSRPISPGLWFWSKFVIGLAAVLGVLDGVTILASWNAPRESSMSGMSWAYVGCFPMIHALLYALAVLGTCWLRRPAIGGILAILGYAVLTVAITAFPQTHHLDPIDIYNRLIEAERAGHLDFQQHGYPLVYGMLAASILLLAALASRLARPLSPAFRWLASLSA
jgi:hypothetical protein